MSLRGKRIFIMEDNSYSLSIALLFLQRAGAIVKYERGEYASVERIKDYLPLDLILLDIGLGKVSGEDVFDSIKQIPELAQIPIVAVTASDMSTMLRLRQKGFSGFVSKPLFPNFASLVERVLAGEEVWIASSSQD